MDCIFKLERTKNAASTNVNKYPIFNRNCILNTTECAQPKLIDN